MKVPNFFENESYPSGVEDRADTLAALERLAGPVLGALAEDKLIATLPVRDWERERMPFTYLEAYARTLSGVAPWLELGPDATPEGEKRASMLALAIRATHHVFDPSAADYQDFDHGHQPLVEAAYIGLAFLRAPKHLWSGPSDEDRTRIIARWKACRKFETGNNNWLFFSAMLEAALWKFAGECNRAPIETAIHKFMEWYVGDGCYGDGPDFQWDYYNSYVIHPMMLEILKVCREKNDPLAGFYEKELKRAQRYGVVLERLISPEGTFPVIGRSACYRYGAMQLLEQLFLTGDAPASLAPGPTRSALTTVIRRMTDAPGTFDAEGWLQIGAVGHQPQIREYYNSTGALYLTVNGLIHLGLPPDHDFWKAPGGPWTQRRIWLGDPSAPADHALEADWIETQVWIDPCTSRT